MKTRNLRQQDFIRIYDTNDQISDNQRLIRNLLDVFLNAIPRYPDKDDFKEFKLLFDEVRQGNDRGLYGRCNNFSDLVRVMISSGGTLSLFKTSKNESDRPFLFMFHFIQNYFGRLPWDRFHRCEICKKYFYKPSKSKRLKYCSDDCKKVPLRGRYRKEIDNMRVKIYRFAKRMSKHGHDGADIEKFLIRRYGKESVSLYYHPAGWSFMKGAKNGKSER